MSKETVVFKLDEIKETFAGRLEQNETCLCGLKHFVRSQEDNSAEYTHPVYLGCACGRWVLFQVPVN